jgi:hypothetical protein
MLEILYLRGRSTFFRRLAKDYDEAGHRPVSDKLTEVAAEIEAQVIALELERAARIGLIAR